MCLCAVFSRKGKRSRKKMKEKTWVKEGIEEGGFYREENEWTEIKQRDITQEKINRKEREKNIKEIKEIISGM